MDRVSDFEAFEAPISTPLVAFVISTAQRTQGRRLVDARAKEPVAGGPTRRPKV